MNFRIKDKSMLWIFGSKKKFFPKQEIDRKMIFPWYLRNLHTLGNNKDDTSGLKEKKR